MTGTTDPNAWNDAQRLLREIILLREPGADKDDPRAANELEPARRSAGPSRRSGRC